MARTEETQYLDIPGDLENLKQHRRESVDAQPGRLATLRMLNEYDNPRFFHGDLVMDDGQRQLWRFPVGRGWRYAQRWEMEEETRNLCDDDATIQCVEITSLATWSADAEDFENWNMAGSVGVPV